MAKRTGNHLLEIRPDTVECIRKMYDLDKPARLEDALQIIVDWINKQDHIIEKDFDPSYLELTLMACKGSVEKAKRQIDHLCTMRTLVPKFFSKFNVKMELNNISDLAWIVPLPKLTEDNYRIVIYKLNPKNFTAESFMEYYQYNIILTEYIKRNDYFNGLIVIDDYSELNLLEVISKMNTAELQQFISIIINGYGARLKSIHILTDSTAIDLLIKIVKQFFSEKIGNRIYVQKTLEDLHKVLPKDLLPVEYGGNERSIATLHDEWIEEISSEKHVEYMKMRSKVRTDETKRIEGKFNEEYLGMPGSFRDLRVD